MLNDGKPVSCSPTRPIATPLNIPPGPYYIDYSITLRGESFGSKKHAPIEYRNDVTDWGPYKFIVKSGEHKTIEFKPSGHNSVAAYDSLNGFLSYLYLGSRNAYLK